MKSLSAALAAVHLTLSFDTFFWYHSQYLSTVDMNQLSKALSSLSVSSTGLSKNVLSLTPLIPLIFVRTATKKVSGSKTSNRDSAGRRLGPKKGEGERVKVGDILYRQRGTVFYPGENVAIGKDHTLVANEVGYVRFYRDPFHPKRKFIGIAINKDDRLPTPHFSPRNRRLGYVPVENERDKEEIMNWKSRKETLALPEMLAEVKAREEKRQKRKEELVSQLKQFINDLSDKEIALAGDRLLSLYTHLVNGRSVEEARKLTDGDFVQGIRLAKEFKKEMSDAEYDKQLALYQLLATKLDSLVMFGPTHQLCKYYSEEELNQARNQSLKKIKYLASSENCYSTEVKAEIRQELQNPWFTLSERVRFGRAFIRNEPPRPVSKEFTLEDMRKLEQEGKGKVIQNWNYDKNAVEPVFLPKGTNILAIH